MDRSEVLASLLLSLEAHYQAALRSGFDKALTAFRARDYLLSRTISVETRQGPVVGAAAGIDDRGALLVELPHRRVRSFHSGDVSVRH